MALRASPPGHRRTGRRLRRAGRRRAGLPVVWAGAGCAAVAWAVWWCCAVCAGCLPAVLVVLSVDFAWISSGSCMALGGL